MSPPCQRCGDTRVVHLTAKCSDLCVVSVEAGHAVREHEGCVPDDLGVGGGDYVSFSWCLACGRIQGAWPLPESELEAPEGTSRRML